MKKSLSSLANLSNGNETWEMKISSWKNDLSFFLPFLFLFLYIFFYILA